MSKIKYLKAGSLADLKANLSAVVQNYGKEQPWLDEYFASTTWIGETNREMPVDIELQMPELPTKHYDAENSKIIYTALRDLPLTLAIDERFWTYLTHVVFWDYMKARWPLESALATKEPVAYLREHYFFMGNRDRALIRNASRGCGGMVEFPMTKTEPIRLN